MKNIIRKFLEENHYASLNPKAVLFDMDGVLYDSMPNHTIAWEKAITEVGITCTREEFYLYEGQTGRKTIRDIIRRELKREALDEETKEIYSKKTKYFTDLGKAGILPGAAEVLNHVGVMGLTTVLVTGSGQDSLLGKLESNFPGIFTVERMVTAHDVQFGKPDPEPYLMGLKKAGVNANEALVVENAPLGVESASKAGIFTIAVNTGPLAEKVLYDAGAQIVLSDMSELNEKLPEILEIIKNYR